MANCTSFLSLPSELRLHIYHDIITAMPTCIPHRKCFHTSPESMSKEENPLALLFVCHQTHIEYRSIFYNRYMAHIPIDRGLYAGYRRPEHPNFLTLRGSLLPNEETPVRSPLDRQISTKTFPSVRSLTVDVRVRRSSGTGCVRHPLCFCKGQIDGFTEGLNIAMHDFWARFPDLQECNFWLCGSFPLRNCKSYVEVKKGNMQKPLPKFALIISLRKEGKKLQEHFSEHDDLAWLKAKFNTSSHDISLLEPLCQHGDDSTTSLDLLQKLLERFYKISRPNKEGWQLDSITWQPSDSA